MIKQRGRVAATEADDDIVPRVVRGVEGLHVVDRDTFQSGDGAGAEVAVARAGENFIGEDGLAEFLVAGEAELILDEIERAAAQAVEVCLVEGGREQRVAQERVEVGEVVDMRAPGDDGHLHRRRRAVGRCEGKELIENLVVAPFLCGGLGEHRRGEGGETLLTGGIVLGTDLEPEAEGNGRVFGDGEENRGRCIARDGGEERQGHEGGEEEQAAAHDWPPFNTITLRRSGTKYFLAARMRSSAVTASAAA